MIYQTNHALTERLEVISDELVDWGEWAAENAFLGG
jgi:hypothetical protein